MMSNLKKVVENRSVGAVQITEIRRTLKESCAIEKKNTLKNHTPPAEKHKKEQNCERIISNKKISSKEIEESTLR